ncbi:phosphotransferase [Novosphingobium pentaromativorans]|uniref:CHK kinase-like domain-containing protein n=1 Tax=Novosphingobium pentaromativorans US6-1 TaxID=1088721 RepID=G6E877_9SPHN|nr:phosphotransferase [Novosphingobium pentaromativorans]AIT81428.1 hypothetical protein JI59_17365 [Novosphingobium pentaromativorans US6-1]EHJ62417.1 hypothetical protein NSU_0548 [Novosphingobium pentaromativorans US6-1]
MPSTNSESIPRTLDGALDPEWLTAVLAPIAYGDRVSRVEVVDPLQINQRIKATIVRFRAHFESGRSEALCLKGFLDRPEVKPSLAGMRETRFYTDIAGKVAFRHPAPVAMPFDEESQQGIRYMRDLVEEGAHFCSALEPFDASRTARSLEQLAKLHASYQTLGPVDDIPWTGRNIEWISGIVPVELLQKLLLDERSKGIPEAQQDAHRLLAALKALSAVDAERRMFLIHGDCHAGNVFEIDGGAGLIDFDLLQKGGWSLDVVYHINATLPVEVSEKEERALLRHYLETAKGLGSDVPDDEEAWKQYRMSAVYGYFLWGITQTVKRDIINAFCHRLSHAVARHDSYRLLGV